MLNRTRRLPRIDHKSAILPVPDWSLREVVFLLVALVVAVFAIRVGVSFNFTEWTKQRTKRAKIRLQLLCPHATFAQEEDGRVSIQSLLHSPPGTIVWICSRCQLQTTDERAVNEIVERYARYPEKLIKEDKKFQRALKRQYRL